MDYLHIEKSTLTRDIPLQTTPSFSVALSQASDDVELIPIAKFAHDRHLDRDLVWAQIQAGRLRARVKEGEIYILHFPHGEASDLMEVDEAEAPQLAIPESAPLVAGEEVQILKSLIEHFSSSKNEQAELARLTRSTIEHIRSMSEELSSLKDRLLLEKDSRIETLEKQVQTLQNEAKKLFQAKEDLEILVNALDKA